MRRRIWDGLWQEPLCNHRPDRGIYIHGYCLPLCARCTGILAGAAIATMVCRLSGMHHMPIRFLVPALVMVAPTGMDGLLEYACGIESNNPRRVITGFLAGIGCVIIERVLMNALLGI